MQTRTSEFYTWFSEPLGICQGDILQETKQETKLFVQFTLSKTSFMCFHRTSLAFCNKLAEVSGVMARFCKEY
jgi:hypothetical protein